MYVLTAGRWGAVDGFDDLATSGACTHLLLNDVALAGCVEGLLSLGLGSLPLLLLLLFSELLNPLQLLLDRRCLNGHHVSNLCRQHGGILYCRWILSLQYDCVLLLH